MKCPNCKRKNDWDAVYCKVCGSKLPDESVSWFRRHKKLSITLAILVLFYFFVYRSISTFFADVDRVQYEEDTMIQGDGEDIVALINIDGIIVESDPSGGFDSLSSDYTSSRKIKRTLNMVTADENVKAVVLRVNSPGGSAAASDQIFEDIKLFKNSYNIPVVAYFTDTAASGGYYVSMSADKIIANPANITGGVGVIVSYLNFADFIDRYGIRDITYKSGELKDLTNPFSVPSDIEAEIINEIIEDVYDRFVDVIVEGRKLDKNTVIRLSDGRIYSAKQAVDNQLIDSVGQLGDAFDEAQKLAGIEGASLVEFGRKGFLDLLFEVTTVRFDIPLLNSASSLPFSPGINVMYLYR